MKLSNFIKHLEENLRLYGDGKVIFLDDGQEYNVYGVYIYEDSRSNCTYCIK